MKNKRATIDPMITMINVVFLLIAFFMFGQFSKPAPIAVELPMALEVEEVSGLETIFVDQEGVLYFQDQTGDQALNSAKALGAEFQLQSDKSTNVNVVIVAMRQLREAGLDIKNVGVTK